VALGAGFDAAAELPVARQELAAGDGQAHPGCGTAAGRPLEELEAGSPLELLQVAPRVPVRHPEIRRGLPQGSLRVDRVEEPGPAVAELQPRSEHDPHPELGFHGTTL